jgi:hypothetical protein
MDEKTVKLLDELRHELNSAKSLTEGDLKLREQLLQDIDELMQREDLTDGQEHQPFVERLKDAVEGFEATHPSLATGMARVINALVNMGV